jgi:hypothetical protein
MCQAVEQRRELGTKDGGFRPAASRDSTAQQSPTGKECPGEFERFVRDPIGSIAEPEPAEHLSAALATERIGPERAGLRVGALVGRGPHTRIDEAESLLDLTGLAVAVTMLPAVTVAQWRAVSTARRRPASDRSAVAA